MTPDNTYAFIYTGGFLMMPHTHIPSRHLGPSINSICSTLHLYKICICKLSPCRISMYYVEALNDLTRTGI